jgi:tripartite-type tricarboxylate transporter receptor subunit TctC
MVARRRDVLKGGSAAVMEAALPASAIAQGPWPSKPIKIVCTYPPGGLTDVFARAYGEHVSQKLGQPVVVENKAGAAGAIGAEIVKQCAPDGYTLMFTNSTTMVQNKALFKKLPYDPDKDFVLVSWHNTGHLPTVVNKDVPAKNLKEFADWAKGRKVSFATYGAGSYAHVVISSQQALRVRHRGGALSRRRGNVAGRGLRRGPGGERKLRLLSPHAADGRRAADRRADARAHEEAARRRHLP